MLPVQMSDAQRAFVQAAEALGATAPASARSLTDLPRLSARELDALVDLGLVREAADWTYYVFRSRATSGPLAPAVVPPSREARWSRGRLVRLFVFWLLVILIPVLLLQVTSRR
jgi:hypothetical protein